MICYSIGNPHRPVNEIAADELIDLIACRSRLEKRYAYLIMRMDMFKHAIKLRDGEDKRFGSYLRDNLTGSASLLLLTIMRLNQYI